MLLAACRPGSLGSNECFTLVVSMASIGTGHSAIPECSDRRTVDRLNHCGAHGARSRDYRLAVSVTVGRVDRRSPPPEAGYAEEATPMNLAGVNTNLLVSLNALLREQNVSRAAEAV